MKVGFFLNQLDSTDCRGILQGNPGIGGSEYEILLVSYLLEQRSNEIDVNLLLKVPMKVPHKKTSIVGDIEGLCNYCTKEKIHVLIINQSQYNFRTKKYFDVCANDVSLILWDHNGMHRDKLDDIYNITQVKRIVCCGREMLDLYRDHIATLKSTYVYNIFPFHSKQWYKDRMDEADNHNVVYMGVLNPIKGFHVLAKSWKRVLDKVPDAQLYVIGSGKLYDKNVKLGKYGLASEDYEQLIMPYLEDSNGQLLPSVHFMGLMGTEKFDVMGKCKVGVPNPTGISETFCICGIEMQLMGCNITTIRHPAYLDTVFNHKYLYKHCSCLADYIIDRLLSPRDNYDDIYNFVNTKFGVESSILRWEKIIQTIDEPWPIERMSEYPYQLKSLKNTLLHLKMKISILNRLSLIRKFYDFYKYNISKSNQW